MRVSFDPQTEIVYDSSTSRLSIAKNETLPFVDPSQNFRLESTMETSFLYTRANVSSLNVFVPSLLPVHRALRQVTHPPQIRSALSHDPPPHQRAPSVTSAGNANPRLATSLRAERADISHSCAQRRGETGTGHRSLGAANASLIVSLSARVAWVCTCSRRCSAAVATRLCNCHALR